ncbi:MAG: hypothetical protein RLZZ502_517 [Pseudomonadota bacterium]
MCGVIGIIDKHEEVGQRLYDGLTGLQHRGQDAAGITTAEVHHERMVFHAHKSFGMVRDVFRTRHMRELRGRIGIGHCRYPTAGSVHNVHEAQPFYVNAPYGIALGHNGNLTNSEKLRDELTRTQGRHINTNSDSEVLLNVLAQELGKQCDTCPTPTHEQVFAAITAVHQRAQGAYAVVSLIAGLGLVAFRDPFGIRPLCYGISDNKQSIVVTSESAVLELLGCRFVRDIAPGETVIISPAGQISTQQCAPRPSLNPCLFEFVYLARPDSVIDGISVYDARVRMGASLVDAVKKSGWAEKIDVVIPIPDSSRHSALELAMQLGKPYREGFVKNRYIGRTFIMPGQPQRKKSVRAKLNPARQEFEGKTVLLVDDSIVRGTTSGEIVQMARDAGAKQVVFASAAPPVRYANVYGIDMPRQGDLIAHERSTDQIRQEIHADGLIYQDLNALRHCILDANPSINDIEDSCFSGRYITGVVSDSYLSALSQDRQNQNDSSPELTLDD